MGVLGLTPFLAKHCPDLLRELPHGLRALSGKTIVIDATLITQRLHFAPVPHKNRHVLGWYRLISDLKSNDVKVICVFDGKERSAAKMPEVLRRREGRVVTLARGALEDQRAERLGRLHDVITEVGKLPEHEAKAAAESLKTTMESFEGRISAAEQQQDLVQQAHDREGLEERDVRAEVEANETPEVQQQQSDTPLSPPPLLSPATVGDFSERPTAITQADSDQIIRQDGQVPVIVRASETPMSTRLAKAYLEYAQSVKQLRDLITPEQIATATQHLNLSPSAPSPPALPEPLPSLLDIPIVPQAFPLVPSSSQILKGLPSPPPAPISSKTQQSLSSSEHTLFTLLSSYTGSPPSLALALSHLRSLSDRSSHLLKSYQRRAEFPSDQTYLESRRMIGAMGVPCVEANVPYEAEGLASAIVLAGKGDVVASEDTDVILYGAPLLRGLTSRKTPLVQIDSALIPSALSLSSNSSFIDLALLFGTDFTQRLKNIGPETAFKVVKSHGSIEGVLEALSNVEIIATLEVPEDGTVEEKAATGKRKKAKPKLKAKSLNAPVIPIGSDALDAYLEQVRVARDIFTTLPDLPPDEALEQRDGDEGQVMAILDEFGIRRDILGYEGALEGEMWNGDELDVGALAGNYFGDYPHYD